MAGAMEKAAGEMVGLLLLAASAAAAADRGVAQAALGFLEGEPHVLPRLQRKGPPAGDQSPLVLGGQAGHWVGQA